MDNNPRHLFICAIGPVQDFIATARTSHDLEFGSWLLSELSKAGAKALSITPQQLIFPAPEQNLEPGSELNVANKVLAVIEGDPGEIGINVRRAIEQRLMHIYRETYKRFKGRVDHELAEEQITDLLEFYWVSVPYVDNQNYRLARAQAEALLSARKNTRNFKQHTGQEERPKSSLDGFRESVLLDTDQSLGGEDALYSVYHVDAGEVLSGVDLLKRWGEVSGRSFPSTTDIAAMPFQIMLGEKVEDLQTQFRTLLKAYTEHGETEGTLFYCERLVQLIPDKEKRKKFREQFARIFREAGIHQRPNPYYALLLADGDNMGKTIDAQATLQDHQRFSHKLSEFAAEARGVITEHGGVPIYVGGDDVLTYLPLHTALDCFKALDQAFTNTMQGFTYTDESGDHAPTLSGGLVLAHHLTPLSDVLDTARRAEKQAKKIGGKHSLAIISSKRGGADRSAKAKASALLARMPVLIGYMQRKEISTGTAYELLQLHQQLQTAELPAKAFEREALRIILRKRAGGGGKDVSETIQKQSKEWFKDEHLTLDELAQEMIIASEFAKAYDMAKKEAHA